MLTEYGSEKVEEMLQAGRPPGRGFRRPLRPGQHLGGAPRQPGAARQHALHCATRTTSSSAGEVILIDEFTGRMMTGRRLSEGLHQAIEAKEGAEIQPENQTLASVTIQNYFRLYTKLSGMTGTAATEAQEFGDIYKMDVSEIPTNRPVMRIDDDDEVYRTERREEPGHPRPDRRLLSCAASRSWSAPSRSRSPSTLSELLNAHKFEHDGKTSTGIPHQVLNARYHEQEAFIVADAGVPGAVTIATNMAGRGTDIQLGGNVDMRVQPLAPGAARPGHRGRRPRWPLAHKAEIEAEIAERKAAGAGRRRPLRAGHRAPRKPADRQPAARPHRPPGRPGPLQVLPLLRGRPAAHLRRRAAGRDHAHLRRRRKARRSPTSG